MVIYQGLYTSILLRNSSISIVSGQDQFKGNEDSNNAISSISTRSVQFLARSGKEHKRLKNSRREHYPYPFDLDFISTVAEMAGYKLHSLASVL